MKGNVTCVTSTQTLRDTSHSEGCHDEYELRVSENKVQLTRIRDENGKFRSNSVSILNVTFA